MSDDTLRALHSPLPQLVLHDGPKDSLDCHAIAQSWLDQLSQVFESGSLESLGDLFIQDCWWRDLLTFSWSFTTKHGIDKIQAHIASRPAELGLPTNIMLCQSPALSPQIAEMGPYSFLQFGLQFENDVGCGKGIIKLSNVAPGQWKAWVAFTRLESLRDQGGVDDRNEDRRHSSDIAAEWNGDSADDLQVLVVGAGQAGLGLAAHLKHLGLRYVVLDRASKPGAAWLGRYETLKMHTPTYMGSWPFLDFPENAPMWLSREDMARWNEFYPKIMDLKLLMGTEVVSVQWQDDTRRWSVQVRNGDGEQTLHPRHIVQCTGVPQLPRTQRLPGIDNFQGQLIHSTQYTSAKRLPNIQSKRVTVIGTGSSGWDIAQDLVESKAASVTLIQRGPAAITTLPSIKLLNIMWNTPGVSKHEADFLGLSIPFRLNLTLGESLGPVLAPNDRELLDNLKEAGVAVRDGTDGISLYDHFTIKLGSVYVDQGACGMVLDGRIKVEQCDGGVVGFTPQGPRLANDKQVASDIVIDCTGLKSLVETVGPLMGEAVGDKVKGGFIIDDEGERRLVYRPTGVPGYWAHAGAINECRQYAPILALQIKAVEEGLNQGYYGWQASK